MEGRIVRKVGSMVVSKVDVCLTILIRVWNIGIVCFSLIWKGQRDIVVDFYAPFLSVIVSNHRPY